MVKRALILVVSFGLVPFALGVSLPSRTSLQKELHFDRFDGTCERNKHLPITINYTIFKVVKRVVYFNITLNVKEDIPGEPTMNIKVHRCLTKDNLDTCEEFLSKTGNNYCSMIDPLAVTRSMSPWKINYQPPYKCPIQKGTYYSYNSPLDTLSAMVVPLESWYWKGRIEVVEPKTNRKLQCTQIEAHLINSPRKSAKMN